jgi:hypothetical protein
MRKLLMFFVVFMLLVASVPLAYAVDHEQVTLTFQIYATGYASDSNNTGTTIPAGAGAASWTSAAGASKFFTLTYEGNVANTADNRTIDMKKWAPNGIEKATLFMRYGMPIGAGTGVTSVATGAQNALLVGALGSAVLTNSAAGGVSAWTNLNNTLTGTSRIILFQPAASGVTTIPVDVTTLMTVPTLRYYRFFAAGVTTTMIPGSGTSQWPGSPAGTAWASEIGPKMYLTIVPKR